MQLVDAALEYLPLLHETHTVEEVAPVTALALPAAHAVHEVGEVAL